MICAADSPIALRYQRGHATLTSAPDDQVMAWDDNFRDDGALFLVCSERDVDIEEYRRVLSEHIRFRFANEAKP